MEEAATDAAVPVARDDTCRNCGAHATGHFCPNCGQETRVTLPTFSTFMREAFGRYVSMDGRFWRTMAGLVARPGYLTLEYLRGRRRRYIRPARLFLVLYLMLFAVIGLLQSPGDISEEVVFVDTKDAAREVKRAEREVRDELRGGEAAAPGVPEKEAGAASDTEGDASRAPAKDSGKAAAADAEDAIAETTFGLDKDLNLTLRLNGRDLSLPPQLKKRWDHFKKLSKEEKAERLYAGLLRYGPYAMAAMLPAFALLLQIAYLGRSRRYPGRPQRYAEHLVYSAHMHAFAAVTLLVMLVAPFTVVRWAMALWIVYYVMRARQVVYRGRWWAGLLRALLVAAAYFVILAVALLGLIAITIMMR